MHPDLSFEQAPPIAVPYRFFLTAPWFGVAAGALLAWSGEDAWASRWSPGTLAATHLLVVGYMLQAMVGALFQFVPVAVGGNVWRPRLIAALVHPLLLVAALALVAAFLGWSGGFLLAGPLFGVGAAVFLAAVGVALWRTTAQGPTLRALRVAAAALAVTVALGATLAEGIGRGLDLPLVELADVHAAWGIGGWAFLLLAGVSFHVVPMFQLTPPYPARLAGALPPLMLSVLVLRSGLAVAANPGATAEAGYLLGLAVAAAFAVTTLRLQLRRRRKIPDPTLQFFRLAMICLLAIAASAVALELAPELAGHPRSPVWIGVLALAGAFASAINGMLYRIVPFINWLDLQRLSGTRTGVPNVREMIGEAAVVGQMRLHFAAVAALLAAVLVPALTRPAGALFAVSCAWLGWNLAGAARRYRQFRDRIAAAAPGPG